MTDPNDAQAAIFLDGLGKILVDLEKASKRDMDMVMLIGSLAGRLCADAGKSSWIEVKQSLSDADRNRLIGDFGRQIEDEGRKGQIRIAYAMQAVASSLVGDRFTEARISIGVKLLDEFILSAQAFFQRNAGKATIN